jgi:hypothetical protein
LSAQSAHYGKGPETNERVGVKLSKPFGQEDYLMKRKGSSVSPVANKAVDPKFVGRLRVASSQEKLMHNGASLSVVEKGVLIFHNKPVE